LRDIQQWLESLGLEKYVQVFSENDIGLDILPDLIDEDFKGLGVSLGDRKRLKSAIQNFNQLLDSGNESAENSSSIELTGEAERRHLTVMFCDLVGSTNLSTKYDPEDLAEIIRAFQDTCAGIISRYEGYIARYMGDGMLVYFGYPHAHEEDAERALRTGLEIIDRVTKITPQPDLKLSTRVGVATGLVVVGETIGRESSQEQVVLGETPNLAARLQSMAEPDQLLIADDTRRLCGDVFEYLDMGKQSLKGFDEPVFAYVVKSERKSESRFEARSKKNVTPLIGRKQEINLMMERWHLSRSGEGQLILLTGEAGIGKSRITHAMIDAIEKEDHYRISFQCSPYHRDSSLYPIIQHLRFAANLESTADVDTSMDNLDNLLRQAGSVSDEQAALIAMLVGLEGETRYGDLDLTPQQQRTRTLLALKEQLVGLSRQKPVLFIFEDAHWIDPTTQEYLDILLNAIAGERVLMLVTGRPTYIHGFGGHPIVTRLMLNRLGRDHVSDIVSRLTHNKPLPDELLEEIVLKTDGVPLFVEELTKAVLESDLVREKQGRFELREPLQSLSIPITLHDSLMARLDRFPSVKEVAQVAACIGREFDYSLIRMVSPLPLTDLDAALEKLIEAELVYRRGIGTDTAYQFKHALVRDAAYESLLKRKRQKIHSRLVVVLEQTDTIAPELIAHHATKAGLKEKAVEYWQQAGDLAIARPAYLEALGHFSNAIKLAAEMGEMSLWRERELELQLVSGQAFIASKGYGAQPTVDAFQRALSLADTLGDTPWRIPALFGEWAACYIRGVPFMELAERFVNLAEESGNSGHRVVAQRMLVLTHLHQGQFEIADTIIDRALKLYDPTIHKDLCWTFAHDPRTASYNYKAWVLWFLGYPTQSENIARDNVAWAYDVNHVNTIGIARCWGVLMSSVFRRDTANIVTEAQELIEYCNEMDLPLWRAWSRIFFGWALVLGSQEIEGLQEIENGLSEAHSIGAVRLLPLTLCLAAEANASMGELELALKFSDKSIKELERSKDLAWTTHVHQVRAEIFLLGDPARLEDAEAGFLYTIDIARKQAARSMELRAALSLAKIWINQGDDIKAHSLLQPIYEWFTEGFETTDLREAKALLDSISP